MLDNRYKILKQLGEGGFGITHLARDMKRPSQPICVVKELHPQHQDSPKIVQWFNQEAQVLERLGEHDQIPRLLASFQEANHFYLVQEYIKGETLREELDRKGFPRRRPSEAEVVAFLRDVLTVLAFVHEQRVIHRDIKPDNLMRRERDHKIMLIDFGVVKQLTKSQINAAGQITRTEEVGTYGYSPYEQIQQGNPRLASDIYALGMTAIELLTGISPRKLKIDPRTGKVLWRDSVKVSQVLGDFIDQMVHFHYQNRFSDAGAALQVLTQRLGGKAPEFTWRRTLQWLGWSGGALGAAVMGKVVSDATNRGSAYFPELDVPSIRKTPAKPLPSPTEISQLSPSPTGSPAPTPPSGVKLEGFQYETVQLDDRGTITNRRTLNYQRFQQQITNDVNLLMVPIPAGKFLMGSPESEKDRDSDEGPQREVSVPAFYMAQTPTTQAQWKAVAKLPKVNIDLKEDPSQFKGVGEASQNENRRPVENVSWWEAQEFCDRLSKLTGLAYRLPSEAEWEYACRAGTTTPFYFGETITTDVANYDGNYTYGNGPKGQYRGQTTDVATFAANPWGLYDMHGNVWEWCADHYRNNYQGAPIDGSAWLSNKNDDSRSLRGGSWLYIPRICRSALRDAYDPSNRNVFVGFRVVCRLSA